MEKARGESNLPNIDRKKFLVPQDLTFGQFQFVVRKRIQLKPDALYCFVGETSLVPVGSTLQQVYAENKAEDNFLYVKYASGHFG